MEVLGEKPVPAVLCALELQHGMICRRVAELGSLLCSNVYAGPLFICM